MRLGFIGNTNNYPFMLARAMIALGHEVIFVVSSDEALNRPEFRYSDISTPYPAWIRDVGRIRLRDIMMPGSSAKRRILENLKDCDAVIANDFGPLLLPDLGVPGIAMCTGSDLYAHASFDAFKLGASQYWRFPALLRKLTNWIYVMRLARPQRAGIRSAVGVVYFPRGILPSSDVILDELGISDERRIFNLMTDAGAIGYIPPPSNERFRVFCGARINWASLAPPGAKELVDYKGAEIMVRGLALFVNQTSTPIQIRLVKKGMHLRETAELIDELGLAKHVLWLDEMTQADVGQEYAQADVVFDQLGNGMIGMVTVDAMATGRPVIANGRPDILEPLLHMQSPICQAKTPEEVRDQLIRLASDPMERERVGVASRRYAEECFSSLALARRCIDKLDQVRAGSGA